MEEAQGIHREEVLLVLGALADITTDTDRILAILGGEDDDDEEEEADT